MTEEELQLYELVNWPTDNHFKVLTEEIRRCWKRIDEITKEKETLYDALEKCEDSKGFAF